MKTDDSKAKYIIGNLLIPVTDEIQAKLKGDYSTEKLKKVFPAVFDRPHIVFLEGSVMCVDSEGLDRWATATHPDKIAESDVERITEHLTELRRVLSHLSTRQDHMLNKFYVTLRNSLQPKPSLLRRIFKRKKQ